GGKPLPRASRPRDDPAARAGEMRSEPRPDERDGERDADCDSVRAPRQQAYERIRDREPEHDSEIRSEPRAVEEDVVATLRAQGCVEAVRSRCHERAQPEV